MEKMLKQIKKKLADLKNVQALWFGKINWLYVMFGNGKCQEWWGKWNINSFSTKIIKLFCRKIVCT
jgi:hypothetical protein